MVLRWAASALRAPCSDCAKSAERAAATTRAASRSSLCFSTPASVRRGRARAALAASTPDCAARTQTVPRAAGARPSDGASPGSSEQRVCVWAELRRVPWRDERQRHVQQRGLWLDVQRWLCFHWFELRSCWQLRQRRARRWRDMRRLERAVWRWVQRDVRARSDPLRELARVRRRGCSCDEARPCAFARRRQASRTTVRAVAARTARTFTSSFMPPLQARFSS